MAIGSVLRLYFDSILSAIAAVVVVRLALNGGEIFSASKMMIQTDGRGELLLSVEQTSHRAGRVVSLQQFPHQIIH